jgi:adenylate cyclase
MADTSFELKLEIAHILTIDVVAYSTLLINEQSHLIKELNRAVRETPCFRKAESEGQLLRLPTGDGMVLVFQSDVEAPLQCAREISAALKNHPEIRLRMGIHSGPVSNVQDVNDRMNVAGAGIDTAQRVMDCGDAGHILLSRRVAEDLVPFPRWNCYLHDLGECEVKHGRKISLVNFHGETFGNPARPEKLKCQPPPGPLLSGQRKLLIAAVAIVLVVAAAIAGWRILRSPPPNRSIAVLPFADVSPAKDQEYFSDGITEQIINSLAKVRGLFVVARTSSFAFKNRNQDVREVGQRLHVNHVLEGSVSHGAGKFRVDVRLVDVSNGYQVWSQNFDSSDKDVLSLQSDIAQKVAAALQFQLGIHEIKQIAKQPTYDPEAYDFYLHGRYLLNKRTPTSVRGALALFRQAVAKDPRFALGHAGLADSYIQLGKIGVLSGEEASARAWPEVSATIALDDQLAEGYVSRGILLTDFDWNWPAAETDFQKALELDPGSASAHHWYARHLAEIGRSDEALREIASAQKLDPLSPMIRVTKAKILLAARRPEQAIDPCRKALEMEPGFASAYQLLGRAYTQVGEHSKAIEAAKKFVELSGGTGWAKLELAYAYARAGDRAETNRIVTEVTTGTSQFSPYDMAAICSAERDIPGALAWLEKAIKQRTVDVIWIRVDPRLDNVRPEGAFKRILAHLSPRRAP